MIRVADLIQRPIFILSVQGERIVFEKLNSHYETKVGISTDLVQGKTAGEFLPQRVAETIEKNYRKCIADRHDYRYEEVLDLATGECWWSTTLSPVFDAEGEVAFIIGIAEDITREKTERMRLVEKHATLKQRNADILSFATAAAHDIRPTIGNVQAIIEHVLIGFKDLGDQKIQHLRLAQSIAAKTQDYINEVLGRIVEVENQEPAPELVDVGHIVSDIAAAADPYSKLDISYPRVHVEAESTVLQIVLRNLIDNATRFANTTVRVEVFQSPVRPGQIGIRVTDDGEGFPGGSRAFTSRIRPSDNMEGRTNGFGLRAIQQLTEARGGLFWLGESPDLPGAAFCVSLPGAILRREEGATLRLIEGNRTNAEECPMLAQAAVG